MEDVSFPAKKRAVRGPRASADDPLSGLVRGSIFWTPERFAQSAWTEHIPFAFWLVDVLRPRTVVELGTFTGVSYSAICQAVKALALPSRCFAVDTWTGDQQTGFYPEDIYHDFLAFHNSRYSAFSSVVRSTFDEDLSQFEDGSIDLLHIDGAHQYEAVKHDYETWLPKLSPHGVILFHDTNERQKDFGVAELWREVSHEKPHFEFLHGHGLGVLGLGAPYPEPLTLLLETDSNSQLCCLIRNLFNSAGRSLHLSHEQEIRHQRDAEISALRGELENQNSRIENLHSSNDGLCRVVEDRDARICELRKELNELILELEKEVSKRDSEISDLQTERDAILSSTSWRVTAPLRRMRTLLFG